jgi:F-type H+-transporting ATPase subunit b
MGSLTARLVLGLALGLSSCACAIAAPESAETHPPAAAAGSGHGAEAHGADSGPLEFKTDLAIWTAVVFLVLLAVLWKFAWGPISEGLDRREQRIADDISAAKQTHEDAKQLLAEYDARLAAAHEQVRGIIEEARRDAEHTQQQILAKARADAAAELERAKKEIETATSGALKELAESAANMAVSLAGRIVQTNIRPEDHNRLIEQALASLPDGNHNRN